MAESTVWTQFMDMHSGGGCKQEPYEYIYIEAPAEQAEIIFYNRFGHNPDRITCTCCGSDYSTSQASTLAQATGYERHLRNLQTPKDNNGLYRNELMATDPYFRDHYYLEPGEEPQQGYVVDDYTTMRYKRPAEISLEAYLQQPNVLVIYAADIKPEERIGDVPQQGYVWVG